ncbi:XRE family transcriptional regulator [Salmonella enterica subsp. diarizonae]|uniref:helix-turn-helix domain-containing protein n=1 Tax=Enterobacteriaceae TaxID=543 RepID=UPI0003BCAD6C|nr:MULTISPECIES: helix-turn-helix transcriptional regulator [Enterobacteriaceae]EAW1824635.1 XRE family transcriptional regulator [Salmonella enterica subsp. diarizonae]EDT6984234.1 helix-turn-helix transcriptional regulator [Salmonella enterica subsp. arizonae]ESJ18381.1 transcriptional regulator HipB [Salmonella enterica subsp. diarizonae serovar 60:r:e,n,x,z15 str. 01-0170]HAT2780657.1 helix-turn-helix transcriptional regulator [Citrobacter koseri]EAQ9999635.1 XRE family transcriptional reg
MNTVYPLKTLNQLRPLLVGFRKANGLTQKEVSERLGVTQQTYARLEANPASASIERLFKVFTVLGVEMVLSSGPASIIIKPTEVPDNQVNSPARREKW